MCVAGDDVDGVEYAGFYVRVAVLEEGHGQDRWFLVVGRGRRIGRDRGSFKASSWRELGGHTKRDGYSVEDRMILHFLACKRCGVAGGTCHVAIEP